jgi:hypothetical protein
MTLDLNNAPPQRSFDLIPAGKIVTVQMIIRPGGVGEDGWLKRFSDGSAEGIDAEFTVIDTEYAKRKIWQTMILSGSTDGHAQAAKISRTLLRGIVESAFNIRPDDLSDAAQAKRKVDFAGFNNLRFIARISIEKSKDPAYDDKNKLSAVTPDMKTWKAVEQLPASSQIGLPGAAGVAAPPQAAAPAKPTQAIARPAWAAQRQG